ncbi:putative receptor-like protein kinase At5g24010 [Bidens hawaiensis]|uniref:putative receptor-like protein kinase At5g24010 n=1 Tax=Bidens hawaiensis TaxID=980011 RepID=UPI00404AD48C
MVMWKFGGCRIRWSESVHFLLTTSDDFNLTYSSKQPMFDLLGPITPACDFRRGRFRISFVAASDNFASKCRVNNQFGIVLTTCQCHNKYNRYRPNSQWLKICIGAARGLDYLHTGTSTQDGIIHRDVKSSNILLDENYAAKIADFGLAKIGPINQTRTHVSTAVKGTFGYMDPNYFYTGRLTRKSDVYAFGVVLIEVLSGRPALDESLDEGLAIWAQDLIKQGKLSHIVRPSLRDHISKSSLKEFSCIAARCLISHPNQRPTMTEVLGSLDRALAYQERSTTSSQGRMGIKNVWSLFSLGRSGTSESKEINERTTIRGNVSIPVPSQEGENNRSDASNPTYDRGSNVVDPVEDDRVETYMPGVYVTISSSPDGTNKLKRVRFSRRNFDEQQAGTWWSENRKIVFERYNIHEPGPVG